MLRGLFEGAQYNSEAGAKCTVYSRARTKQGRGVIKEIRYLSQDALLHVCRHSQTLNIINFNMKKYSTGTQLYASVALVLLVVI